MSLPDLKDAAASSLHNSPKGSACVFSHCGEYLQGVLEKAGKHRRVLVTQRASAFHARAEVHEVERPGVWSWPPDRGKAVQAARLTLAEGGAPTADVGLLLVLTSDIPLGLGAGSSSSDCLAASRAVQAYLGTRLTPEREYQLCVQAEQASDPLMFDRCVLAAHREGLGLADLGPLPQFRVVSFDSDTRGRGVDTDKHPRARYDRDEVEQIRTLLARLELAAKSGDLPGIAVVGSQSAAINQRHLPNRAYSYLKDAPRRLGALGFTVAHSGTAASLLFDPACGSTPAGVDQLLTELRRLGYARAWVHSTVPPADHSPETCWLDPRRAAPPSAGLLLGAPEGRTE